MSVHEEMKWWQKGTWLLIIGGFLVIETRAISKDRWDSQVQATEDQKKQETAFGVLQTAQEREFEATAQGLKDAYVLSQQQFSATMRGVGEDREAITGSKSYAYITPVVMLGSDNPGDSFPTILFVQGKYPMRGMSAEMGRPLVGPLTQESYAALKASQHSIAISESDTLPGVHDLNLRVGIGKYYFKFFSMGGICTEYLDIERDEKGQLTASMTVYKGSQLVVPIPKKTTLTKPK